MIRFCKHCGDEFHTADHRKIYCGKRCKHRAVNATYRERNRKPRLVGIDRSCEKCGDRFNTGSRPKRKYCSILCRGRAGDVRRNGTPKRKANFQSWYRSNSHRVCAQAKAWREDNPVRAERNRIAWRSLNRDKLKALKLRRRSRDLGASGHCTAADIGLIRAILGDACLCCQSGNRVGLDHVVPLARGGSNYPSNIQLLCRFCNSRKGARNSADYRTEDQKLAIANGIKQANAAN